MDIYLAVGSVGEILVRHKTIQKIENKSSWICIHRYEAAEMLNNVTHLVNKVDRKDKAGQKVKYSEDFVQKPRHC